MRIVFVKPILPYPPEQGTSALTLGLLDALAPVHDVTLCARLLHANEARWIPEIERRGVRVCAVLAPNRRSIVHRLAYRAAFAVHSALSGVSRAEFYDACGPLRRAAAHITAGAPADLAVIEYWHMSALVDHVRARRYALLAHDVDFAVDDLRARHTAGVRSQRGKEIAAYARFDVIFAVTEADKRTIEEAVSGTGGRRPVVMVLPYVPPAAGAHDAGGSAGATAPASLPPASILLFGSLHADFNRDAVAWFLDAIAPRVWASVPEARVIVGGSGDTSSIAALARDARVDIVGRLARPAEWMQRAGVVVVPLRIGGGVHVRVIDALRAGAAIVSTPIGVTGLPVTHGREALVAETADAFAEAVIRVLRDTPARAALMAHAHAAGVQALDADAKWADVRALFRRAAQGGDAESTCVR